MRLFQPLNLRKKFAVVYCINPWCTNRENPDELEVCQQCSTPLLINERFRLLRPLRPLTSGSPFEVFDAVDIKGSWISTPGSLKVLKILNPQREELLKLIRREAAVLKLLDHPGIPKVDLDDLFTFTPSGSSQPLHCLAIQKIVGQNLDSRIQQSGRISQSLALDWLGQLGGILDYVHKSNFFHRDIKPTNIIIQPNGQLALIDFGGVREVTNTFLAKLSGRGSATATHNSHEISVVRTAWYSPPEQNNGQAVPQSDFYALGRTFVYLLTGADSELPVNLNTGRLSWREQASQVDPPLADFIDDLMALAPLQRPHDTQVLLQYIERLPKLIQWYRRRKSPLFKAGIVLLALLVVLVAYKGISLLVSRYYFLQAKESEDRGEMEVAKKNYRLALQYDNKDVAAYNNLAAACHVLRDLPCALTNYEKALELNEQSWEAHYNLGRFYDDQGKYALAEKFYNRSRELGQNLAVDALNNLSRLKILARQDYPAAIELAKQGLQKTNNPSRQAVLLKNLGWAELKLKHYDKAFAYLEKSIKLNPKKADAHCLIAQIKEAQNNFESANRSWEVCLLLESDLPEVREWKIQLLKRLQS